MNLLEILEDYQRSIQLSGRESANKNLRSMVSEHIVDDITSCFDDHGNPLCIGANGDIATDYTFARTRCNPLDYLAELNAQSGWNDNSKLHLLSNFIEQSGKSLDFRKFADFVLSAEQDEDGGFS